MQLGDGMNFITDRQSQIAAAGFTIGGVPSRKFGWDRTSSAAYAASGLTYHIINPSFRSCFRKLGLHDHLVSHDPNIVMFSAADAQAASLASTILSIIILLGRTGVAIWCRRVRDVALALVGASIAVIIARVVVINFVLKYGTASDAIGNPAYFKTHDPAFIKEGTILSLVSRVLVSLTCWLQICILLLFYSPLLSSVLWTRWMIRATWAMAALTFVAIMLTTFLECTPFSKYWQLQSDTGHCSKAYAQLLVQGISNIVLDLMLLVIALPLLKVESPTLGGRLRIWTLFAIGTFCIIVTILRTVAIFQQGSAQATRSLWASVQMVVSVFVANVPPAYGMFKVAKRKKTERLMRRQSTADDLYRVGTGVALAASPSSSANRAATSSSSRNSDKAWSYHQEHCG